MRDALPGFPDFKRTKVRCSLLHPGTKAKCKAKSPTTLAGTAHQPHSELTVGVPGSSWGRAFHVSNTTHKIMGGVLKKHRRCFLAAHLFYELYLILNAHDPQLLKGISHCYSRFFDSFLFLDQKGNLVNA